MLNKENVIKLKSNKFIGDLWGGLGAMLVALPAAIAFGVTILSPLGGSFAAQGALAGILGAIAIGLVAPALGGTKRLISAPCAPAAAVLSALVIEMTQTGVPPETILIRLSIICLLCGALQLVFGFVGVGRLIKYMPYPVVSGYLTGVGLIIIISQIPKLLGAPKGIDLIEAVSNPANWNQTGIIVGTVTMLAMAIAPKLTKTVPAAIIGISSGIVTYFIIASFNRDLMSISENPLIIGSLGASGKSLLPAIAGKWSAASQIGISDLAMAIMPGITLALLLSIDTLKTCVVLDAITKSRHDSNRELIGQGVANLASTVIGGIPGAGTMGATLINISGGAHTRLSGIIEGIMALLAFAILGNLMAWVPIAALAGILLVIGFRMIDWHSFSFLRNRSTILDFVVIIAVVVVAETISLIAASATGIVLAILLFVREQVGTSIIHRKSYGNEVFSRQTRLPEEMEVLQTKGSDTAIFELQGGLFFGTTDQLYRALEPELKTRRYIVLDMRRVQHVDITATHMLEQIEDMLTEKGATLLFSDIPRKLPTGRDMKKYFDEVGLALGEHHVQIFAELDSALEWVENRILADQKMTRAEEKTLELKDIALFAGRKKDTMADLELCIERRSYKTGDKIFSKGEDGDELFIVRRGVVKIVLPIAGEEAHQLATIGQGNFFGEMSFLDKDVHSADAVAQTETELFILSRAKFDEIAAHHKKLAGNVLGGLAMALSVRLRYANSELRALRDTSW